MATIDTITTSCPLRAAAAIALLLGGACTAVEPDTADPSAAAREDADRPVAASDALDDAVEAWRVTCHAPGLDGLCVSAHVADTPAPCGRLLDLTVVPRSPAAQDAGDVLDGLVGDIDQFTRGSFDPHQVGAMGNAALARFDAGIERFLAVSLDSKESIHDWWYDGEEMIAGLAAMKRFRSPEMNVRAALRTAILYAAAHDKISAGPHESTPAVFCAAVAEYTDPLVARAQEAAQWCVDEAARNDYDGPLVDRCRALVADFGGVRVAPTASEQLRPRE